MGLELGPDLLRHYYLFEMSFYLRFSILPILKNLNKWCFFSTCSLWWSVYFKQFLPLKSHHGNLPT